ncbi:hypothetical protein BGZ91_008758, partial [Linnemannia elongata]
LDLYGPASADITGASPVNYADSFVVLIRSNFNPTSLTNITWSVISHTVGTKLSYSYPTFTSVDCAVADDGSFTAFVRSPYRILSNAAAVPMGIQYAPGTNEWSNIYGAGMYGWSSDAFVHKSFYDDEGPIQILTGNDGNIVRFGIVDSEAKKIKLQTWFEWVGLMISGFSDSSLSNYRRQGFFTRNFTTEPKPRLMAYRGTEIYVTGIPTDSKGRYMSYSFDRSTGFSTRIVGVLEGPRITFKAHYIFSGILRFDETSNELFFGCIGEMGGTYKLYTTVRKGLPFKNQSYVEHDVIRSDTTADFTVHESFQTVGGKLQNQFPFVVALTNKGLYEFGIFGSEAGKMKGPYKVVVDGFSSLPSRVVTTYTDRIHQSEISSVKMGSILGGIIFAIMVPFALYAWMKIRKMKILLSTEKKHDSSNNDAEGEQGKQELHIVGSSLSLSPAATNQDQIVDLEFSRHPRPNIVTSIGNGEGREV